MIWYDPASGFLATQKLTVDPDLEIVWKYVVRISGSAWAALHFGAVHALTLRGRLEAATPARSRTPDPQSTRSDPA